MLLTPKNELSFVENLAKVEAVGQTETGSRYPLEAHPDLALVAVWGLRILFKSCHRTVVQLWLLPMVSRGLCRRIFSHLKQGTVSACGSPK